MKGITDISSITKYVVIIFFKCTSLLVMTDDSVSFVLVSTQFRPHCQCQKHQQFPDGIKSSAGPKIPLLVWGSLADRWGTGGLLKIIFQLWYYTVGPVFFVKGLAISQTKTKAERGSRPTPLMVSLHQIKSH